MPAYDTFFLTLHRQSWFQDTLAFYKTTKTMKIDSPSSITPHEASSRLDWISTRILPGVAVFIISIPLCQWTDFILPDDIVPVYIIYMLSVIVLWSMYMAVQYAFVGIVQTRKGKDSYGKTSKEDNNLPEKDKQKQRKYVLDAEFKDYLCTGHSVVIYQHRPRVNEAVYIDRMMQRFMSLSPDVRRSDVQVITFPRYSVRDYFAISINEDHRLKIKRAISNLVNGVWGSGKKPMCRLPISIENALSNETPNSPTKLHSPTKPGSNVGE